MKNIKSNRMCNNTAELIKRMRDEFREEFRLVCTFDRKTDKFIRGSIKVKDLINDTWVSMEENPHGELTLTLMSAYIVCNLPKGTFYKNFLTKYGLDLEMPYKEVYQRAKSNENMLMDLYDCIIETKVYDKYFTDHTPSTYEKIIIR